MKTTDFFETCQYCSQVSKRNGEDPIGTAGTADHWLIFERPQPWRQEMLATDPLINQLIPLIKKLFFRRGILVRPIAIAPDRDYSDPTLTRAMHYWRPQKYFAQYSKTEYLVPVAKGGQLAIAILHNLLGKNNDLPAFEPYLQPTQPIRDVLICTHTQVDLACGRFGTPLYRQLRRDYAQVEHLRIWQSTHFGGHQFAPTLLDLPIGQFWGHLDPDILDILIDRQGALEQLRPYYRGWAGLNKFEQIAEREIWMQVGWDWQQVPKTGRILKKKLKGLRKVLYPILRYLPLKILQLWLEQWTSTAAWVDVEIRYQNSSTSKLRRYVIRVLQDGIVNSAKMSVSRKEDAIEIIEVPQFKVGQITKFD